MPYQTQSPRVLQHFGYWGANGHSHTQNHLSSLGGKPGFPKSHITLLAQPDSFCWLHKPESWSNTIFSCCWGGFKSSCTGRNRGSADGHLCLSLSLVILETCPELSETIPFSAQSKGSEKVMPLQCKFFLVNQTQKSMPGSHLLWHC